MRVEHYLDGMREAIACTRCGRCCANSCPAKKALQGNITTCTSHPSIVGNNGWKDRSPACDLDPVDVATVLGIACPPVLEVIKLLTGIELKSSESNHIPGQYPLRGHQNSIIKRHNPDSPLRQALKLDVPSEYMPGYWELRGSRLIFPFTIKDISEYLNI
jgi:hypothetical protein